MYNIQRKQRLKFNGHNTFVIQKVSLPNKQNWRCLHKQVLIQTESDSSSFSQRKLYPASGLKSSRFDEHTNSLFIELSSSVSNFGSVCLKDKKWTQTNTKVTLHSPTTRKLLWVSNERYGQKNLFYFADIALILQELTLLFLFWLYVWRH